MSQPSMTVSNTHGVYVTYDPRAIDEMAEYFYSRINTSYGMDALRMFTVGITGVDNWWNGETPFEMFVALSECGVSPMVLNDYIKKCARDDEFADKVHSHKVNVLGWLCNDYRCMTHHSESIITEAYEMNKEFDYAALWLKRTANSIERVQELLRRRYNTMDTHARRLAEIKGEHYPTI